MSKLAFRYTEDDLKILSRILSIYPHRNQSPIFLPYFINATIYYMPVHRLTHSEYALQQVVESFGNLLFSLHEHNLIHTYRLVFRIAELENIDYLVLRYLNTGLLPFEEFSEERLFDGEI